MKALKEAYSHLGFTNKVYRDKSLAVLRQILAYYADYDHTHHDCIAVTILTHGSMDELYARDAAFPADEMWQPFEADKCPSLAGRPKIFVTQACKGHRRNPGVELQSDGCNVRIATQDDFIWGFSTCRGDISYRHCETGSIYIQALCQVILEDRRLRLDFASILSLVHQETNRKLNEIGQGAMQCPNFTTTLMGKVHFPKKRTVPGGGVTQPPATEHGADEEHFLLAFARCSLGFSEEMSSAKCQSPNYKGEGRPTYV